MEWRSAPVSSLRAGGLTMYGHVRSLLFSLDAERAHGLTIAGLRAMPKAAPSPSPQSLVSRVMGMDFPNPFGLAAGFDKNAEVPDAMLQLGFGFAEVGTITPRPQQGNERPRLFRLLEDRAVINRLGFNNGGLEAARERLKYRRDRPGIVGANVGANKDSEDRIADYVTGISRVLGLCSYVTINISSPNTPGLRALQSREALAELVGRCLEARGRDATPLLLKIAPDLIDEEARDIAEVAMGQGLSGLIVSNTTIDRPASLRSVHARESGGLSGKPLMGPSTLMLRQMALHTRRQMPLIGAGGISSAQDAYVKIRHGASLVQLYTALIYEGPGLVRRMTQALAHLLARDGFATLADAVGADLETI
jgi:dihydroorotate dehydrogenase